MHGGSHRDMHSHMDTQTCIDVNGHTGRGQRRPHSDWDWGCKTSVPCHPATAEHFISALLQEATYKSAERLYLIQRNLTLAGCTHETRRPLAMMRRQKKKKKAHWKKPSAPAQTQTIDSFAVRQHRSPVLHRVSLFKTILISICLMVRIFRKVALKIGSAYH